MILGIDASNISSGGGLTHLKELISNCDPVQHGISKIIVWGEQGRTLDQIEKKEWLELVNDPMLEKGGLYRWYWQNFKLSAIARDNCDVLFVPGGTFLGNFHPFVAMSQNLLPFDSKEQARFGIGKTRARYQVLKKTQTRSFKNADGVIFLTNYARDQVVNHTGPLTRNTAIIHHGISEELWSEPRIQKDISEYSPEKPFKWLYVSIVNMYKHQWNVVEAVSLLRQKGLPVELHLIGPAYGKALQRLNDTIDKYDSDRQFICYNGPVPHNQLDEHYKNADAFVFASTCENLPIILLESMAAGLPIVCSNAGPMPEVLKDYGLYANPENIDSLTNTMNNLAINKELRSELSQKSYTSSLSNTWKECSKQTMDFLVNVFQQYKQSK